MAEGKERERAISVLERPIYSLESWEFNKIFRQFETESGEENQRHKHVRGGKKEKKMQSKIS